MLIEFSGEHTGSVLMFGKNATDLLQMMGQSGNTEGAISAPDVPAALASLQAALKKLPADDSATDDPDNNNEDQEVSLHNRAVPLIDLLEENVAANGYVMWKPQ